VHAQDRTPDTPRRSAGKDSPPIPTPVTPPIGTDGSPRRRPGRPTAFTPELGRCIVRYLESGSLFKDAVNACGISEATAYEWLARAESRDRDRPPTPDLIMWGREVREAQALPMVVASNWLFMNKPDVWLARRDPGSWGPNGHARHEPPTSTDEASPVRDGPSEEEGR
jgi:hypothetical protein